MTCATSNARVRRIVYVVTHPITAKAFLNGQIEYMTRKRLAVTVVASPGPELDDVGAIDGVTTVAIPIRREIHLLWDLVALWRLLNLLRRDRPAILNASTPKAAFLGLCAGRVARIPVRVYTLRGLRLETTRGLKRWCLALAERLSHAWASRVICVSPSLMETYRNTLGVDGRKLVVLGSGSSNGVDVRRIRRTSQLEEHAAVLRAALGLGPRDPIVGFVGRLTRDKGLEDLYRAFRDVTSSHEDARLLLVGDFESGDPLDPTLVSRLTHDPSVIITGFVIDTLPYYALMDTLVLPSHREGLPNVVLEAGALSLPVVAYDATGTRDALESGRSGTLVPRGDAAALAEGIMRYLDEPALAASHGQTARQRVEARFSSEDVWRRIFEEYERLLALAGE